MPYSDHVYILTALIYFFNHYGLIGRTKGWERNSESGHLGSGLGPSTRRELGKGTVVSASASHQKSERLELCFPSYFQL